MLKPVYARCYTWRGKTYKSSKGLAREAFRLLPGMRNFRIDPTKAMMLSGDFLALSFAAQINKYGVCKIETECYTKEL